MSEFRGAALRSEVFGVSPLAGWSSGGAKAALSSRAAGWIVRRVSSTVPTGPESVTGIPRTRLARRRAQVSSAVVVFRRASQSPELGTDLCPTFWSEWSARCGGVRVDCDLWCRDGILDSQRQRWGPLCSGPHGCDTRAVAGVGCHGSRSVAADARGRGMKAGLRVDTFFQPSGGMHPMGWQCVWRRLARGS
jgi:hypothetical protein